MSKAHTPFAYRIDKHFLRCLQIGASASFSLFSKIDNVEIRWFLQFYHPWAYAKAFLRKPVESIIKSPKKYGQLLEPDDDRVLMSRQNTLCNKYFNT